MFLQTSEFSSWPEADLKLPAAAGRLEPLGMSRFEKTSTNQTGTTQRMKRHQDRNAVIRCPSARSSNPHPSSVQVSGRRVTKIHPCCPNMVIAPSLIREAELFNTPLQRSLGRSTPEFRVLR